MFVPLTVRSSYSGLWDPSKVREAGVVMLGERYIELPFLLNPECTYLMQVFIWSGGFIMDVE
jgi:hypothetical protein